MSFPTHLTCPFCPAQAYPQGEPEGWEKRDGCYMYQKYMCPARHEFLVEEEVSIETRHAE